MELNSSGAICSQPVRKKFAEYYLLDVKLKTKKISNHLVFTTFKILRTNGFLPGICARCSKAQILAQVKPCQKQISIFHRTWERNWHARWMWCDVWAKRGHHYAANWIFKFNEARLDGDRGSDRQTLFRSRMFEEQEKVTSVTTGAALTSKIDHRTSFEICQIANQSSLFMA